MILDRLVALSALSLLAACAPAGGAGTDSGNALTAELTILGEGDLLSGAREVTSIQGAWIAASELEFRPCQEGGEDVETDYAGNFVIDLAAGETLGTTELDFDTVCRLEFELERADAPGEPMDGLSLRVDGTTAGGLPFSVQSERRWEFEILEELPLQEAMNRLDLLFDANRWFDDIDPDLGEVTEGTVLIDGAHNAELLDVFEDALEASARLGRN